MSLTAAGRLLHARDAATGNARSPRVHRRLDGTKSVGDAADWRQRRAATLVLKWRDSARYDGTVPWRHRYARTHNRSTCTAATCALGQISAYDGRPYYTVVAWYQCRYVSQQGRFFALENYDEKVMVVNHIVSDNACSTLTLSFCHKKVCQTCKNIALLLLLSLVVRKVQSYTDDNCIAISV